ncbi:response regulator transcription factor [Pseudoduganella sp. UC29_71]|uniref:response regulator transcription factor n=1 Tax=Pseudoduganella sp. UC29_71 TaxID=3350174 RepID=UPI0036718A10
MPPGHSTPGQPIRVLLVCDLPIAAWGLEQLILSRQPALALTGSVRTVSEAQQSLRRQAADVVVYDVDGANVLGLIAELLAGQGCKVLVVGSSREPSHADAAVLAGANGMVCKSEPVDMLFKAIEKVCAGEFWMDRLATMRILASMARSKANAQPERERLARLTRKERLTVAEVARDAGATSADIAARLGISERTLRNHLTAIYAKLGVSNRLGLFDYARRHLLPAERAS